MAEYLPGKLQLILRKKIRRENYSLDRERERKGLEKLGVRALILECREGRWMGL